MAYPSFQIAPSLLACDLSRLGEEVRALEAAGVDVLHLDVMDGHFVPNITFGFPVIEAIRQHTKLPLDAHLMISDADRYLDEFARAGCNWLSVHVEAAPHLHRTLSHIRSLGMKAGIAINPGTSLATLDAALEFADYVLVMSVNPGFGGQKFIPACISKVRELRKKAGDRCVIQIDGGIKEDNLSGVVNAGADCLVMGTGFFGLGRDYAATVTRLRHAYQGARA